MNRKRINEIAAVIESFSFTIFKNKMKNDFIYVFDVINVKSKEEFAIIVNGYTEKPYITTFDAYRKMYLNKIKFSDFFNLLSVEQKEEVLYHLDVFVV